MTEADQASFVVKLHIQALAHRLSFVTLLKWNDFTEQSDHDRNMGLLYVDGSPKPSYHAYTFMTRTIGDRRDVEWTYEKDGTRVYWFGDQQPVWVAWNALRESTTTIDVGEASVFPCDLYGTKLAAIPVSGEVEVEAKGEPTYLVPVGR